ncbi:Terminal uridylyltransferase cid1 [Cladobotryum mycophilum]|uniref:Terminal uridylyltransferase cid1 n=1 Tax=Cladobotryum mycophilum TaxID=491253 RepID=A0ABR0T2E6_9HYPO
MSQPQDEQTLGLWESLQLRPILDVDSFSYARDLQLTLDKIKKIPSIQLLLLEQGEQETPSQYYARTRGIFNSLKFDREVLFKVQKETISRYISGICHEEIRDAVKLYLNDFPEQSDLQAVGCRHKSFHLACELERALEKELYDTANIAIIRQYIDILRSPLFKVSTGFAVPIPAECYNIVTTIKTLKDPHGMSLNQSHDRYRDPLEFPKTGAGVQCDINFSAHLALQNTLLLRCYSHTDARVRPMVLFVKHWAKVRGINSGYRGTLSSYGYVLMVLHYLVNIAQPFLCPNLQQLAPKPLQHSSRAEIEANSSYRGYNVQFWRNEQQIIQLALSNQLNHNTDSIGNLLRGFFEYFAQNGAMSNVSSRGFDWGRDVISLRTHGGLLSKQEKGWTGAKTVYEVQKATSDTNRSGEQNSAFAEHDSPSKLEHKAEQVKEVRLRYLFAIEDPFELDHNVARTVTHNGIVSIRDEFRRAWRIIRATGNGNVSENLLQDVDGIDKTSNGFWQLLADIHGPEGSKNVQT